MNAKEAKKLVENRKEYEKRMQQLEEDKLNRKTKEAEAQGLADSKKVIYDLDNFIAKIALSGKQELKKSMRHKDEETGYAYLKKIEEEVIQYYTKGGYKISTSAKYNYAPIYEGTMNPEVAGYEYIAHELNIEIRW